MAKRVTRAPRPSQLDKREALFRGQRNADPRTKQFQRDVSDALRRGPNLTRSVFS